MPRVAKKAGIYLLAFPYSCRAPWLQHFHYSKAMAWQA